MRWAGREPTIGNHCGRASGTIIVLIGGPAAATRGGEAEAERKPVAAVEPASAPEQALYRLEYKLRAGQAVHYDMAYKSTVTTLKDQFQETTQNESSTRMHFHVTSVTADGTAELESFIDHVKTSYRFGEGKPVSFDSQKDAVPPRGFEEIQNSIGRPLARLKVEKSGKLVSAVSLRDNASNEKNDVSDDPARNFLVALPAEPVAVGAAWTQEMSVKVRISRNLTNKVTLLRKYQLASVENHLATIRVKTDVLTPVDDPQILMQLIQRTPEGTILLDLNQGLIMSRVSATNKTEVGVVGRSSMRAVSTLRETLVPAPTVAAKP
jgi:hypothetical protein